MNDLFPETKVPLCFHECPQCHSRFNHEAMWGGCPLGEDGLCLFCRVAELQALCSDPQCPCRLKPETRYA